MNKLSLKERMKIGRQPMPQQEPQVRVHNFDEVNHGLTEEQAKIEASRCLTCKDQPCSAGCPVHVQVRDFISAITDDDYFGATAIYKKDNVLPAVCGRVCRRRSSARASA